MLKPNLTELPSELCDHITAHLLSAEDVSNLGRTNRRLHAHVENEGWRTFTHTQFPRSTYPPGSSWQTMARSLSTNRRAWEKRAYIVRNLEPSGHIITFPDGKKIDQWRRPSGQTMGFAPQMDAIEADRSTTRATDVLGFSAGAQICLRRQTRELSAGKKTSERTTWSTYRPHSAREGLNDVTSLHLLPAQPDSASHDKQEVISGTANGELHLISIPFEAGESKVRTYFTTQGLPVQATSLLQSPKGPPLLAAALGNAKLSLYTVNRDASKIAPDTTIDFKSLEGPHSAFKARGCRIWTTTLLSREQLAIGIGMSQTPLQLATIAPTGLHQSNVRSFKLKEQNGEPLKASSVFAIIPSHNSEQTFLSGAFDGVVRLHDMRAPEDVQTRYCMPSNDNAIYCLLAKGHQALLAGTSRHDMIHVFDMRMTSARTDATNDHESPIREPKRPYSLFMPKFEPRGRGPTEGSVYSLTTSSVDSSMVYAGLKNTVLEMAVTEIAHPHPDPLYFTPWPARRKGSSPYDWNDWKERSIKNVTRYEADVLSHQTDMVTTWHNTHRVVKPNSGLDIRWWQG